MLWGMRRIELRTRAPHREEGVEIDDFDRAVVVGIGRAGRYCRFAGVAHRLEYIKTRGYVDFYNDSKATNIDAVQRALESFSKPLILIMGGRDKGSEFEALRPLIQKKVKVLIVMGEAKEKINRAIGDYTETYVVGTVEEAAFMAYQKSRAGDVILFSPGCSSFDEFKNYEERGEKFKDLLRDL